MRLRLSIIGVLLFVFCVGISMNVSAQISVTPLFLQFSKNTKPFQDFSVTNRGKKKAYVDIAARILENPGAENEKEVSYKNPKQLGLIVSPQKLIIAPGQSRAIRVSSIIPPGNAERNYRISVVPKKNFSIKKPVAKGKMGAQVNILIGYELTVRVAPKNPTLDYSITRQGDKLLIKNTGNITFIINKRKYCGGTDPCKEKANIRAYPGVTELVPFPAGMTVWYNIKSVLGEKMRQSTS